VQVLLKQLGVVSHYRPRVGREDRIETEAACTVKGDATRAITLVLTLWDPLALEAAELAVGTRGFGGLKVILKRSGAPIRGHGDLLV
jgi:hypothetical protein